MSQPIERFIGKRYVPGTPAHARMCTAMDEYQRAHAPPAKVLKPDMAAAILADVQAELKFLRVLKCIQSTITHRRISDLYDRAIALKVGTPPATAPAQDDIPIAAARESLLSLSAWLERHAQDREPKTPDAKTDRLDLPHPDERPEWNDTDRSIATYIEQHPGRTGEQIAIECDVSPEHFRSHVWPRLRDAGYYNDGKNGYRPPKS